MSSRMTYRDGAVALVEFIREREQDMPQLKGDEAAIEFIAAWLANPDPERSSLQALCNHYGLNWGVLAGWIRGDEVRNARFQQAMADRDAFRKERLLDGWWKTAEMTVPDEPSHGDVHKAREALAKAAGVFKDTQQTNVGVTVRFDAVDMRA